MNLPLLKAKLSHSGEKELSNAVLFLYKALPKKEKEKIDDGLVAILDGEKKDTKVVKKEETIDYKALYQEIAKFLFFAEDGCYFIPNKWIPKSQRPKWRFLVRKYYKILTAIPQDSPEYIRGAKRLYQLYELMKEGERIYLFSSVDTFDSIQISDVTFYDEVDKRYLRLGKDYDYAKTRIEMALRDSIGRDPTKFTPMDSYIAALLLKDQKQMCERVLTDIVESTMEQLEEEKKKNPSFHSLSMESRIDMALDALLSLSYVQKSLAIFYYFDHKRNIDREQTLYEAIFHSLKKWIDDDDSSYSVRSFIDFAKEHYKITPRKEIMDFYHELESRKKN